jgi:uncharacterized protein (TIGR02271 family)
MCQMELAHPLQPLGTDDSIGELLRGGLPMTMTPRSVAVGLFRDSEDARKAIGALKDAGFGGDDISVLMPDRGETRDMAAETGTKAGEGAATGLVTGGILGGVGGFLVGIGALAIPGVGPFIAAGALATTLGGAAVGAGVGAIAGALIGMGIPKEEAEYYEGEVRGGRTLVTVRAGARMNEADAILHEFGAYDVEHRDRAPVAARGTTSTGTTGRWEDEAPLYRSRWQTQYGTTGKSWDDYEPAYRYGWEMRSRPEYRDQPWQEVEPELRHDWEKRYPTRPWNLMHEAIRDAWDTMAGTARTGATTREDLAGGGTLQLREEELRVQKRPVETGHLTVGKEVVQEQRTMEVPVTREEVTVERRPVDRRPSDRPIEETSRTLEVPVHEERVDVVKRPVVYEEVGVGKRQVTDTQSVSDTVRREEVRIQREGDVNVQGWNEAMPKYRERWQERHGSTGGRWEDYEPSYRYGYEMRSRPEYRGRPFSEVEPSMQSDWPKRYPNTPWDRARDSVREAWDEKIT